MKKLFILTCLVFFSVSIYSKDTIYAVVLNDSVVIKDYNAQRTCGTSYVISATRNGNNITILETDTVLSAHHSRCLCIYNMHITIGHLPPGNYNVIVKDTGIYFEPETFIIGNTTFFVKGKKSNSDSISVISQYQSPCHGPDNDATVSVTDIVNQNKSFYIYPNPANDNITIEIRQSDNRLSDKNLNYQVSIKNIEGQEVLKQCLVQSAKCTVNVSGLSNGIYILSIMNDESVVKNYKLVISR